MKKEAAWWMLGYRRCELYTRWTDPLISRRTGERFLFRNGHCWTEKRWSARCVRRRGCSFPRRTMRAREAQDEASRRGCPAKAMRFDVVSFGQSPIAPCSRPTEASASSLLQVVDGRSGPRYPFSPVARAFWSQYRHMRGEWQAPCGWDYPRRVAGGVRTGGGQPAI